MERIDPSLSGNLESNWGNFYSEIQNGLDADGENIFGTPRNMNSVFENSNVNENPNPIDEIKPITAVDLEGGIFIDGQTVTLSINEPGATYFTTNNVQPTVDSTVYNEPILIINSTTLKFFSVDLAGNIEDAQEFIFLIDKISPTFEPESSLNITK